MTLFVGFVFLLAGTVKGMVGLGLPPIAMGLLVTVMSPVEAAAIVVLPAFFTNVWQMVAGPYLGRLIRRLWPLLIASCVGTLAATGWLNDENARLATLILGLILALYAITGLVSLSLTVAARHQPWAAPFAGGLTGLTTAATGVASMPVVPYFQAIGLDRDELVQAMGLSFTVSAVALGLNLTAAGVLDWADATASVTGVLAAFVGTWIGGLIRHGLDPQRFRRWFRYALLGLGLYLALRSLL